MNKFIFLFLLVSCAASPAILTLDKMNTLIPEWDESGVLIGFKYPYRECVKEFITCWRWEYREIKMPATDTDVQKEIKANDFVLVRRKKP
jgi:hypothetical protein